MWACPRSAIKMIPTSAVEHRATRGTLAIRESDQEGLRALVDRVDTLGIAWMMPKKKSRN